MDRLDTFHKYAAITFLICSMLLFFSHLEVLKIKRFLCFLSSKFSLSLHKHTYNHTYIHHTVTYTLTRLLTFFDTSLMCYHSRILINFLGNTLAEILEIVEIFIFGSIYKMCVQYL